eukprot:548998-Hanusia_phi.AAC.2
MKERGNGQGDVIAILLTLRHSRRHELEESTGQSNVMGGYRRMERMADAYINSHEQGSGRLQVEPTRRRFDPDKSVAGSEQQRGSDANPQT